MNISIDALKDHYRRIYGIVAVISSAVGEQMAVESPNPFYGQSGDLGVMLCEYYGMPHGLTTPLGGMRIKTPCTVNESWRPKVMEALGMEPVWGKWKEWNGKQEFRAIYDDGPLGGEKGPVWSLQRDADGSALDKAQAKVNGTMFLPLTPMTYSYEDAHNIWEQHIADIFTGARWS